MRCNAFLKEKVVNVDIAKAQIVLVDAPAKRLCSNGFSHRAQAYAASNLEQRGVRLCLETRVKEVHPGHVVLSDGSRIDTRTVIWAGGLKARRPCRRASGIKTWTRWAHRRCA